MIRFKAATFFAVVALLSAAQANDGAPPYTFEGSVGPVMELNDQGSPSFQVVPEEAPPVQPATAPAAPPATAPARSAPPSPVAVPAPVVAPAPAARPVPSPAPVPAPAVSQPVPSAPLLQPVQAGQALEAPAVDAPETTTPLPWQTPPQGKSPFTDQEPVEMPEPGAPKPCTKEAFDRGLCVTR